MIENLFKKIFSFKATLLFFLFLNLSLFPCYAGIVEDAQRMLNRLGYESGPIDGVFGKKTRKALESFYEEKNETFDGTLDNKEIKDLEQNLGKIQKYKQKSNNINNSTERYKRSQKMCKIAVIDNLKPFPKGIDDFRSAPEMSTYADLYGDGSIEFITGVSDSTYLIKNPKFPFEGNEKRANSPSEYRVYSYQPKFKLDDSLLSKFKLDDSLLFFNAFLFAIDLNNDKKDDLVIIQQGLDRPPWSAEWNYILISSSQGYKLERLPGEKSSFHGGTAGDIDNNGDIDIIAVPGFENRVTAYLNNGKGKFEMRTIAGPKHIKWGKLQYYFAGLWDFDEDGFLDLILGSQLDHTKIIWGNGNPNYDGPSTIVGDINDYFIDFEFADFDNDGEKELITFNGSYNPNVEYQHHYMGWHIQRVDLKKRNVVSIKTIDKLVSNKHFFYRSFQHVTFKKMEIWI